jgi:WD40 repeat protein
LAAADPTAIWVVDPSSAVASEIDGTGRTIAGPVRVDGVPAAATADALVETPANAQGEPQPGLVAWSVVGHKAQCRVGGDGVYAGGLAVSGNLLAWSDNPAQVHITDMTTCVERWKVPVSSGADPSPSVPVGAFSPDGRTLALGGGSVDPVTLVDVASGAVTSAPTEYTAPVVALVWSADSSRLFWLAGLGGSAAALLTWHVGDAAAEILRVVGLRINPPLLAVP